LNRRRISIREMKNGNFEKISSFHEGLEKTINCICNI